MMATTAYQETLYSVEDLKRDAERLLARWKWPPFSCPHLERIGDHHHYIEGAIRDINKIQGGDDRFDMDDAIYTIQTSVDVMFEEATTIRDIAADMRDLLHDAKAVLEELSNLVLPDQE